MKTILFLLIIFLSAPPYTFSQWEEQNSGTSEFLYCVSAVNDNICWAAGFGLKVIRTTNGGINWESLPQIPGGNYTTFVDIFAFDQYSAQAIKVIPIQNNASSIWFTTNGGINWSMSFSTSSHITSIKFISRDSGMVVGNNPALTQLTGWRTTNGGLLWDSTGFNIPAWQLQEWANANSLFVMGKKAWFASNNHRILFTSNFGVNWVSQWLSLTHGSPALGGVWFNSPALGITAALNIICSTTNWGSNWILESPILGNTYQIAGLIGGGNKYWIACQMNIVMTTDNGASWTLSYYAPGGQWFNDLALARNGTSAWGVRDQGKICKATNLIGINPISKNLPKNFSLQQNYPNPFNPATAIEFDIPKISFVKLVVYDVLGKETAVLVNEELKAGSYNIDFNAGNLSSGIYYYRLQTEKFTDTKKLVVVK